MNRCFRFKESTIICLTVIILGSWLCKSHGFQVNETNSGAEIKWFDPYVTYYINTSGGPSGHLSSIQTAMQTWTNVSSSYFSLIYNGETQSNNNGVNDGINIIGFGPMDNDGTLAINHLWYYSNSGEIIDSDIKFNTVYSWDTYGSQNAYDVQSVATHELGHTSGLADLYSEVDSEKTMYGYSAIGETNKRSLHQDDLDGITYLYPDTTTTTTISTTITTTTIIIITSTTTSSQITTTTIPITYNISGNIEGDIKANLSIKLAGTAFNYVTTNQDGYYTFSGLASGYYIITPENDDCEFNPPNYVIQNLSSNLIDMDFVSTQIKTNPCIAEAIYGEDSEEIKLLRLLRDNFLRRTPEGREIIKLYYQWSPVVVKSIEQD